MVGWIVFLLFMELYGAGVAVYAKSRGMKNYALCLIPFVPFFVMDKLTGGFKVATIWVRKWGVLVIELVVISLAAYLYAQWGIHTLTERNIGPLIQIMWLPVAACLLVFYLTAIQATRKILFMTRRSFRFDWLLCMTLVAIPILTMVCGTKAPAVCAAADRR